MKVIIDKGVHIANNMNKKNSLFIMHAMEIELSQSSKLKMYYIFDNILILLLLSILIKKDIPINKNIISIIENNFNQNNFLLEKIKIDNEFYFFILKSYLHRSLIKYNYYKKKKRINFLSKQKQYTEHDIILQNLFSLIYNGEYDFDIVLYYLLYYIDFFFQRDKNNGLTILMNNI